MLHQPAWDSQDSQNLYTQAQEIPSLPSNHIVNQPLSQYPAPSNIDHIMNSLEQINPSAPPYYMINQPVSLYQTPTNQNAQVSSRSPPENSNNQNFSEVHHAPITR